MLGWCFRPSTLKRTFRTDVPLSSEVRLCRADGCIANLRDATKYHRRYRVCGAHSKAPCVSSGGRIQRFCQLCTKFHYLYEFDQGKRSCRRRLAERNRRRRKPQPEASSGEGPSAESGADLNTSTDPTSTPAQPKKLKLRSASSVSQEDSANKSGSAGNNWQFPTLGGLEHPPHLALSSQARSVLGTDSLLSSSSVAVPVPLSSQATSVSAPDDYGFLLFQSVAPSVPLSPQATSESGPDAYGFLPFQSTAPPVPLWHPKVNGRLSTLLGNSQETEFSHQFSQDLGGREGSTSSYFCLDRGLGLGYQAQRSSSVVMQHYNGMEPPTWSDIRTTVSGPTLNLPPVPEKSGLGSDQQITYTGNTSAGPGYSFSTQNPVPRSLCDFNGLDCHAALTGSFGGQQCGLLEDMFRTSHR